MSPHLPAVSTVIIDKRSLQLLIQASVVSLFLLSQFQWIAKHNKWLLSCVYWCGRFNTFLSDISVWDRPTHGSCHVIRNALILRFLIIEKRYRGSTLFKCFKNLLDIALKSMKTTQQLFRCSFFVDYQFHFSLWICSLLISPVTAAPPGVAVYRKSTLISSVGHLVHVVSLVTVNGSSTHIAIF